MSGAPSMLSPDLVQEFTAAATSPDPGLAGPALLIARRGYPRLAPAPGRVSDYHTPGGRGVRVDSALYSGYEVPPYYDSMVAKLIVHGATREECLMRLRRSLEEFVIEGIDTTLGLHLRLIEAPDFANGTYDTHWLEKFVANRAKEKTPQGDGR